MHVHEVNLKIVVSVGNVHTKSYLEQPTTVHKVLCVYICIHKEEEVPLSVFLQE